MQIGKIALWLVLRSSTAIAFSQQSGGQKAKVWTAADAVLPVSHALADIVLGAGVAEHRIHVIPMGLIRAASRQTLTAMRSVANLGSGTALCSVSPDSCGHGMASIA